MSKNYNYGINRHGKKMKCLGGYNAAPHDFKTMEDARKEVKAANLEESKRALRKRFPAAA